MRPRRHPEQRVCQQSVDHELLHVGEQRVAAVDLLVTLDRPRLATGGLAPVDIAGLAEIISQPLEIVGIQNVGNHDQHGKSRGIGMMSGRGSYQLRPARPTPGD